MKNYAFITLLSSPEYLLAVLVLNQSLKNVHSKYPLVVCVTTETLYSNNVENILKNENIIYYQVESLNYNTQVKDYLKNNQSLYNTASKIQIFRMIQYDKLVYIDADSLILQNIDNLFEFPNGAILKYSNDNNLQGLSGLFVFNPNYHSYSLYAFLIENYTDTDGGLIGKFFFPICDNPDYLIPEEYLKNTYDLNAKVIHYPIKPFLLKTKKDLLQYNQYPAFKEYFHYISYYFNT